MRPLICRLAGQCIVGVLWSLYGSPGDVDVLPGTFFSPPPLYRHHSLLHFAFVSLALARSGRESAVTPPPPAPLPPPTHTTSPSSPRCAKRPDRRAAGPAGTLAIDLEGGACQRHRDGSAHSSADGDGSGGCGRLSPGEAAAASFVTPAKKM